MGTPGDRIVGELEQLEVTSATGLEITSEPPGLIVWLDGAPLTGPSGPVRTNSRAERIAPGHHIVELQTGARFLAWRQGVLVEPDRISRLHAILER